MRVVIQRTGHASVTINGTCKSAIRKGFMILVGIEETDGKEDIDWLCKKIVNLRVFDDENGVMNKSILDIDGEILVISQFTLHASTRKGNRPSYIRAAKPEISVPLYEQFCKELSFALGKEIGTGEFGADMKVELLNDGPVTICMARVMARKYGDQSFKEGEKDNVEEEIADVLWVLLCIANQTGVDITEAFARSIEKKTKRDQARHINNPKLSDHGE